MARFYVGRLDDGDALVDVRLWDAQGTPPAGTRDEGLAGPSAETPAPRGFDLAGHVERLGGAFDEDVNEYLCDLIEGSWDARTMRS